MNGAETAIVVGAGISGLVAALELEKRGYDVHVLEAAPFAGGCIRTVCEDGWQFEAGPNSFPSTATAMHDLAKELGIDGEIVEADPASAKRFIYFKGRLMEVPTSFKSFIDTKILTTSQKFRLLCEPFWPRKKGEVAETVGEFFARRFGLAVAMTLVDAFVSGVYAGDSRRLDLESAFPMLAEMEKEYGSVVKGLGKKAKARRLAGGKKMTIQSFKSGMSAPVEAAVKRLKNGVHLRRRVTKLTKDGDGYVAAVESPSGLEEIRASKVVMAAPSQVARTLLMPFSEFLEDLMCEIEYASVLVIHAGFDQEELKRLPHAFGYLIPRTQRMRTLGWLFSSRIFGGRAPEGKFALSGYIGGATDPNIMASTHDSIRHIVLGELSLALKMREIPKPEYFQIIEQRPGIPQFTVGHRRRMAAIKQMLVEHPGLKLIGNYTSGVSIADCIESAKKAVAEWDGAAVAVGAGA